MLNLIPRFIHEKLKYTYRLREGNFVASVVFADIVGFTAITENLMKQGKRGAEELSILINEIYNPLINSIYKNGGFVANFAGDSITAIFRDGKGDDALSAALSIQENFGKRRNYYRKYSGGAEIDARIGLAFGDISWRVFGDTKKAYCFYGAPIIECAEVTAGKNPGEIAIAKSILPDMRDAEGRMLINRRDIKLKPLTRIERSLAKQFVPEAVLTAGYGGEFRNVVPVFIAFDWSDDKAEVDKLVNDILAKTEDFGGYFNSMFYEDKGPHALIVFGAPISYENNVDRAVDFAYRLTGEYNKRIKIGITSGTVFAGAVGSRRRCTYTVLGDAVNQAARIMQTADWGRVWVSGDVVDGIYSEYGIEDIGEITVKGKTEPVAMFNVTGVANVLTGELFEGEMVGRDKELGRISEFCKPIFDGKFAGVTYVYGDAGIGKSRLLYGFIGDIETDVTIFTLQTDSILRKSMNPLVYGLRTYFGQSDKYTEEINKANFEAVFNGLLGDVSELEKNRSLIESVTAELRRTKSLIGGLLGLRWESSLYDELDPRGRFENTVYALKDFFKAISLLKPVIIQIEDIQWLDNASLEVFQSLSRNIADFPIAIIASSRFADDGSKPTLQLSNETTVNEIELGALPTKSFTALIENRLGGTADGGLSASILERTEGNPFYIEQFCQYLKDNNLIEISDGEYKLAVKDFDIPEGIKSIIIARLDRLSQQLKELVYTASVLGREFYTEILSDMLKKRTVRPLLAEGVSEEIWSALSEIKYLFKHTLLRDTAYEMQLKKRLLQLHKLAGEALDGFYGDEATHYADIAFHYGEARLKGKTKYFLKKAGDFATENYNNDEAIDLYSRLIPYLTDKSEIARTKNEIAAIYNTIGKWDKAEEILNDNIETSRNIENDELLAKTYQQLGLLLRNKGNYDDAYTNCEKAYIIANELGNKKLCSNTLNALGVINAIRGEYDKATELWRKQEEIGRELDNEGIIADVYSCLGNIVVRQGGVEEAFKYHNDALKIYENIENRKGANDAINNIAICCAYNNDTAGALERFRENLDYNIEIGNKREVSHALYNIGNTYGRTGDHVQAKEYVERALAISEELGDVYSAAVTTIQLAYALKELGKTGQAEKHLDNVIPICRELNITSNLSEALLYKTEILLSDGHVDEARTYVNETIATSKKTGRNDVYFESLIIDAKIDAVNDVKSAIDKLKTVAANESPPSPDIEALLYYELYKMTSESEYRDKALTLYLDLNKDFDLYNDIIKELQE